MAWISRNLPGHRKTRSAGLFWREKKVEVFLFLLYHFENFGGCPQRGNVTQTSLLETVCLHFSSEFHKTHLSPQGKTQENRMPSFLGQLTHWNLLPRAHALLPCALSAPASIPTSQHPIWAAALPQVAGCLLSTINKGEKNRRTAKHT